MNFTPASTKAPRVVSLFCGCGGLDLGFKNAGFDLVYSCDNDPAAVSCYAKNVDERVYQRDVTSLDFHKDLDALDRADVVLGGFPCQGFSKAGPKKLEDPRNVLYVEMKRAVSRLNPLIFIAENVDGIGQNFGGAFLQKIVTDFGEIGYDVQYRILQAASYGVPQYRRRVFFVGLPRDSTINFAWPNPTHFDISRNGEAKTDDIEESYALFSSHGTARKLDRKRPLTARDAIGDIIELGGSVPDHRVIETWPDSYRRIFRAIKEGQKLCNVRHASASVYTWDIPEVYGMITDDERRLLQTISKNRRHKKYGQTPNGNALASEVIEELSGVAEVASKIEELLKKKYLKQVNGKYDLRGAMFCSGLFKRPSWDAPSPTVLTVFDNPRYFLHPSENRPFSVRECARLQGFPDSFVFCPEYPVKDSALRDAYRLIGNAVPPPLATHLAHSVNRLLGGAAGLAPIAMRTLIHA